MVLDTVNGQLLLLKSDGKWAAMSFPILANPSDSNDIAEFSPK